MGERTERVHENSDASVAIDGLRRWYHVPVLCALVAFMLWVRVRAYGTFTGRGIAFSAVDPWYHWRTVVYSVENWPSALSYDVWTGYPSGASVGQFGTLFDQLIATAALVVGLGDPSQATIYRVALLSVPVMAALVALPTYAMGARVGGRLGGLLGVALLALFPGTFLRRSTVGTLDHHVAEALFMAIAVFAMMAALRVAERERPVYEQFVDRDLAGLKRPLAYGVLAGVALALYVWTWPPGVILIGIFGVFFAISLSVDYWRGVSPDHAAFVGALALAVAGVLTAAVIDQWSASATTFGYLQPVLAFGVAAGCLFMAWLARFWDARGFPRAGYPLAVLGLIALLTAITALVLPDLFGTIASNVRQRLLFGQTNTTLTIVEAQPPENPLGKAFSEYRFAFYTGAVGLVSLLARPLFGRRYRSEYLLVAVWALFVTSMAFTQIRFNYYLAVAVAVCNAALIGTLVDWGTTEADRRAGGLQTYQTLIVAAVALLVFVPLVVPAVGATAVGVGASAAPSDDALTWAGSNQWLANNTPEEGRYGGAEGSLDYYGAYERPAEGDFAYPEGSYGVLSWWDYGHLITVQGERIPHANPFQQNARSAAAFLLADSEERAEAVAGAIPAAPDGRLDDRSTAELETIADGSDGDGAGIRYVMIDDEMAGGKFSAIATWAGPGYGSYLEPVTIQAENETATVQRLGGSYDETVLSRLYYADAAEMEHYRLVHESPETTQFVSAAYRVDDGRWQPLVVNQEYTPSLQFRMARLQQNPAVDVQLYDQRESHAVKTYERVEGATLTGEAQPGETVTAEVELTAQSSDRTFTYTQETTASEDGTFSMTVPYATTDGPGPEAGYTDSSVVAEGEYEVTAGGNATSVPVPEEAIYGGETVAVGAGEE
ncbi:oligosaccharyl transferase, archaeosortase A system-associated [Halalkalicoccus jeotgali]|uniref:dolichyl-phosphooligosaccharide-protein glycotransferase n=1 Tax=Halalkalicoccus jeotgali (strain DSM 18796 / CECT 7217 / JCM 14584 / KCTC 4019 / B3) TaxID=795797 RepID=D8J4P2_HALJB|nr:oligosaccharyl transferase, archaeosortase A system-associated [Halalkalicoccus jeotgali]ADJ15509.1 Oligosaccharyl transferase STT3 subunit [Halalkalicoccus jeotgali B3]ELY36082.1 Oligosaccharyl transferase STT3 subunit [Halalkalicoccus jeotgali B3]